MCEHYDLKLKKNAIELKQNGMSMFDISLKLSVPVPTLALWFQNSVEIMRRQRNSRKVKKPKIGEGTIQLQKFKKVLDKDRARALGMGKVMITGPYGQQIEYEPPTPEACPVDPDVPSIYPIKIVKEPEIREFHKFSEENPFLFEYNKPYTEKMNINGKQKIISGIVPKIIQKRINISPEELFGPEFSTIKPHFNSPSEKTQVKVKTNECVREKRPRKAKRVSREQKPSKEKKNPISLDQILAKPKEITPFVFVKEPEPFCDERENIKMYMDMVNEIEEELGFLSD